ncbi:hypothetical protein P8452_61730 [Trifolium repens]|nr:hypothetical protein P8452_61730 [Trifolium repens]
MKQRLGRTKPMHQVLHLLCQMVNHIPLKGFVYFPYHSQEEHSPVSASTIRRLVYHCFKLLMNTRTNTMIGSMIRSIGWG